MHWYLDVLKKYAVFSGRASRQEYWMFVLFNFLVSFVVGFIDGLLGLGFLSMIYTLAVLIPGIALACRRMHDTGKSGWFMLIPIYGLILTFIAGDVGDNQYGSDPHGADNMKEVFS